MYLVDNEPHGLTEHCRPKKKKKKKSIPFICFGFAISHPQWFLPWEAQRIPNQPSLPIYAFTNPPFILLCVQLFRAAELLHLVSPHRGQTVPAPVLARLCSDTRFTQWDGARFESSTKKRKKKLLAFKGINSFRF